jgi:hypothetical protein
MARTQARIFTSIWNDDDFLDLTPGAQRLYFVLLSQPSLSYCGVVSYTPRRWALLASGSTVHDIRHDMNELGEANFVHIDEDTEEVWARSFLKHDGVLLSPNLIKAMVRDLSAVSSRTIHRAIVDYLRALPEEFRTGLPEGLGEGLGEGLREGLGEGLREGLGEGLREGLENRPQVDTAGDKGFAKGFALATRPRCAGPPTSYLLPPSSSSAIAGNGSANGVTTPPARAEEENDLIAKAVQQVANRRLARTTSTVTHTAAWLAKTAAAIYSDLPASVLEASGLSLAQLVDMIDPPAKANSLPGPLDATLAAARAKAARNDQPACPTCDTRGGDGKLLGNDGMAVPCPTCAPVAR